MTGNHDGRDLHSDEITASGELPGMRFGHLCPEVSGARIVEKLDVSCFIVVFRSLYIHIYIYIYILYMGWVGSWVRSAIGSGWVGSAVGLGSARH